MTTMTTMTTIAAFTRAPGPESGFESDLHGRGGLSPDLNPLCLRVNATSLDQNARVNGAYDYYDYCSCVYYGYCDYYY